MYYVWQSNADLSTTYLYASAVPEGMRHEDWITGEALVKPPKRMTLTGDRDSPTKLSDMILTQFELPILSPKAISVLKDIGVDNLEYYPVIVQHRKMKEPDTSYQIANIKGLVACLDKKHATFNTSPKDQDVLFSVQQYRLLEDKIGKKGPLIFRLGEFRYHVLAHESVKKAFEKAGLTGTEFIPPEKYA